MEDYYFFIGNIKTNKALIKTIIDSYFYYN